MLLGLQIKLLIIYEGLFYKLIIQMLALSQVKGPILLLLVLSGAAFLAVLGGIVLSAAWRDIGVMMQRSTAVMCTTYLTFKVETLNTYLYNLIFFLSCIAAAVLVAVIVYLVLLYNKLANSQEGMVPWFTLQTFCLLYILYSVGILSMIPGAGYYLTFMIEKGFNCTSTLLVDWLVIGGTFILTLILLVVCWIYLFVLRLKYEDRFEEKVLVDVLVETPPQVEEIPLKEEIEMILFKQRMENTNTVHEKKEPLLSEVDSEDRAPVETGDKQKIVYMDFGDFKKKQELLRQKEEQEERKVQEILRAEQVKRQEEQRKKAEQALKQYELKQKISSMALSPDDEDFDKIFEQSVDQPKIVKAEPEINPQQEEPKKEEAPADFYPANYCPIDQEDEIKYKKYKKKLLESISKAKKDAKRHVQNIEGGRSKKQLQKMINLYKKPKRDEEMYKNPTILESPNEQSIFKQSQYTSNIDQKESATFNFKQIEREPLSFLAPPPPESRIESLSFDRQESEQRQYQIYTLKERTKSPMRKQLFEAESNYLKDTKMGSILGTLVHGVIESEYKGRLKKIKQEKLTDNKFPKKRKNQKLIDFIRSKAI